MSHEQNEIKYHHMKIDNNSHKGWNISVIWE